MTQDGSQEDAPEDLVEDYQVAYCPVSPVLHLRPRGRRESPSGTSGPRQDLQDRSDRLISPLRLRLSPADGCVPASTAGSRDSRHDHGADDGRVSGGLHERRGLPPVRGRRRALPLRLPVDEGRAGAPARAQDHILLLDLLDVSVLQPGGSPGREEDRRDDRRLLGRSVDRCGVRAVLGLPVPRTAREVYAGGHAGGREEGGLLTSAGSQCSLVPGGRDWTEERPESELCQHRRGITVHTSTYT